MEFTPEFIEQQGLSEDQVKGITSFASEQIANLKNQWDGKANDNAEGIINGAIKSTQKEHGIELPRNEGEKNYEYLTRLNNAVVGKEKTEVENLKKEYQEKLKDFKGGDATKAELDKIKIEYDEALQKYANYDEVLEKSTKYDELLPTYDTLKEEVSFNSVKPSFPDTVNKYEADVKWKEFKKEIKEKYHLEVVDGIAKGIDKENKHRIVDLSELLSKNEIIQGLLKGRQQEGTGAQPVDLKDIDGVPFKVPANADGKKRSEIIKEHLATLNIGITHPEYPKKFKELNDKILQGKNQAA